MPTITSLNEALKYLDVFKWNVNRHLGLSFKNGFYMVIDKRPFYGHFVIDVDSPDLKFVGMPFGEAINEITRYFRQMQKNGYLDWMRIEND